MDLDDSAHLIHYDTNKSWIAPRSALPHWREAEAPKATTARELFFPGRQQKLETGRAQRLDAEAAPLLPPPPPPAFMMKRKPTTTLKFGQEALNDDRDEAAAAAAAEAAARMHEWLTLTDGHEAHHHRHQAKPPLLLGFRRKIASSTSAPATGGGAGSSLITALDGKQRDPLVQWPAAVKGRPLLPAGKAIVGYAGMQIHCFRPGPPGVAANIPAHLGGTVRFPEKPQTAGEREGEGDAARRRAVGQTTLDRMHRKNRYRRLWARLCSSWRRQKRSLGRRARQQLPCLPADGEAVAQEIANEARGAKPPFFKSHYIDLLRMILLP